MHVSQVTAKIGMVNSYRTRLESKLQVLGGLAFFGIRTVKRKENSLILLMNNTREYTYLYTIEKDEKGNNIRIE